MQNQFLSYYKPLVKSFCKELDLNLEGLEHLPQPFLPLFGKGYEKSALKIMIMGQDTKGWGSCSRFIEAEEASPGSMILEMFKEVEDLNFTAWGKNTHSFFGFVMALLAGVHGIPDWRVLKWGEHKDVLSSFAWGNCNAIELDVSLYKRTNSVPRNTWKRARLAGARFNRLSHVIRTISPRVIIITCKSFDREELFSGLNWVEMDTKIRGISRYRFEQEDLDVLHTYHPGYMRNVGGPYAYLNGIAHILKEIGIAPEFPEFVTTNDEGEVINKMILSSYQRDLSSEIKSPYAFIEWVALELSKHNAFMSVPSLMDLLNSAGFRTSYGTEYLGGRGSYRLVRYAYKYAADRGDMTAAGKIAEAFRKPDFTYAY